MLLKAAITVLPLLCILIGYIIYHSKYRIDKEFCHQMLSDLQTRGGIRLNTEN